jgi:hypothetical protein
MGQWANMSRRSFEQSLPTLIDRANEFADRGLALIDGLRPEEMTAATLPDATVWKLHLMATINYRAGLVCLQKPETSLGAFTLVRGLLEAWAHLDFIQDNTAGGDARCRALRLERGLSKEWANNVHARPPGFDQAAWQAQQAAHDKELDHLWRQFGCRGANRTQGQVAATLTRLNKLPAMDWVDAVWRSTSAVTHMYGVEFALTDRDDGTIELVWPLPAYRASWLMWLVASYSYLTTTAATILRPGAAETADLHNAVGAFLNDPDLRAAVST